MQKIKIGIIGAGWIAKQHLEVLCAMDNVEVVGITSRTRSKAEALAKEYGIAQCFDQVEELVAKAKPDALMVLVSADQMFKVTALAITFGLPLFIEKPAGMTPEENIKLAGLAKDNHVRAMVGFNRRYYSIFHKGIEIIKKAGPLLGVFVEGHERMWQKRGANTKFSSKELANWIYLNSVHTIDLLRFFGGEPSRVRTIAHKNFGEARGDQFAAIMELESGAIGQYSAHWYSPGGWRVALYGDGVTVEFKPLEKGFWTDKNFVTHEIAPDEIDVKFKPGFYRQMEAFQNLIRGVKMQWPLADLESSYKTMRLAEQISSL